MLMKFKKQITVLKHVTDANMTILSLAPLIGY